MGRRSAIAAVVALMGSMGFIAGAASAQTGYPPGPCSVALSTANVGNFTVGQTLIITLSPTCAWTSGASVTVTVNGVNVGTKTARVDGTVQITLRVLTATALEIDDPVSAPAICGLNSIVGSGPSGVAQTTVVHTVNFGVVCPVQVARSERGLAFTGANLLKLAAAALITTLFGTLLLSTNRKRRRQRVPERAAERFSERAPERVGS